MPITPPCRGGLASLNHNFSISERRIFSRDALDSSGKTGGGFFGCPSCPQWLVRFRGLSYDTYKIADDNRGVVASRHEAQGRLRRIWPRERLVSHAMHIDPLDRGRNKEDPKARSDKVQG